MTDPYPLCFEPILKEKVWGGRRLERYGKALPAGALVGESWEVADLAATSASGAGGGAARSVITNGPLAERTLHDAMGEWGDRLLGRASPTADGGFPLLVKLLDAREHLSVQVHPSPEYARAHPGAHLKTECWYVLEAEAGGVIYKGIKPRVDREEFEDALRDGDGESVVPLLDAVEAIPGEMHNLPSGTVHALGAGVLVAEVQTPSDTTFRVYDWAAEYGRAGRELHVEQALACIEFGEAPGATWLGGRAHARLVTTQYFDIDVVRVGNGEEAAGAWGLGPGDAPTVVMVLEGEAAVGDLELEHGATALVPAACDVEISGDGLVLLARVGGG